MHLHGDNSKANTCKIACVPKCPVLQHRLQDTIPNVSGVFEKERRQVILGTGKH